MSGSFRLTRLALTLGVILPFAASGLAQEPQRPINPSPIPVESTPPVPPLPELSGDWQTRPYLTGDWLGLRSELRDNGITYDLSATQFYQGVSSGGLQEKFRYGGRGDYLMHVDGEKAGLWKGLFIDTHAETLFGSSINSYTGGLLPSSIGQSVPQSSGEVTALTGVKVTQALSESFIVYGGKINTLDAFVQPFASGRGVDAFMNTGLVFNPVLARTIPYSTYGAGFAVLKDLEPVLSLSIFDPTNTPTVSGFNSFFDRGAVIVGQLNIPITLMGQSGHQGGGFTYSTAKYTELDQDAFTLVRSLLSPNIPLRQESGSWSLFYQFDQTLWQSAENPKQKLGLFGMSGISDGNPNPIRWYSSMGLGGSSPIASRPLDTFGVGYFYLGMSDSIKKLTRNVDDEQGVELFYNYAATPWIHLTPDLQVIQPGRSRADTAIVLGLRAKIDF